MTKGLKENPYNVSLRSISPTILLDDSIDFDKNDINDDSRPGTGDKKVVIPTVRMDRNYSYHSWTKGGGDDDVHSIGSNDDPYADVAGPYFTNEKLNERKKNEVNPSTRRVSKGDHNQKHSIYNSNKDSDELEKSLLVSKKPVAFNDHNNTNTRKGRSKVNTTTTTTTTTTINNHTNTNTNTIKVYHMPSSLPNMPSPDSPNYNPYNDIALLDYGGWIQNQLEKGVLGKSSSSPSTNKRLQRTYSAPSVKTPKPSSPQPLLNPEDSISPNEQSKAFYSLFTNDKGDDDDDDDDKNIANESLHSYHSIHSYHSFNDSHIGSIGSKIREHKHGSPTTSPSPSPSSSVVNKPSPIKNNNTNNTTINFNNYHMDFLTVEMYNSKDVLHSTSIRSLRNFQSIIVDPTITFEKFKKLVIEKGMVLIEEFSSLRLYYYNSKIKAWRLLEKRVEWDQAILLAFETAYPLKIMFSFELDEFAFLEFESNANNTNTTTFPTNTTTTTTNTLSETESSVSRGSVDYYKPPPKTSKKISSKLMSSLSLSPPKPVVVLRTILSKSMSSTKVDDTILAPQYDKQQKFAKNLEQRLIKTRW